MQIEYDWHHYQKQASQVHCSGVTMVVKMYCISDVLFDKTFVSMTFVSVQINWQKMNST